MDEVTEFTEVEDSIYLPPPPVEELQEVKVLLVAQSRDGPRPSPEVQNAEKINLVKSTSTANDSEEHEHTFTSHSFMDMQDDISDMGDFSPFEIEGPENLHMESEQRCYKDVIFDMLGECGEHSFSECPNSSDESDESLGKSSGCDLLDEDVKCKSNLPETEEQYNFDPVEEVEET